MPEISRFFGIVIRMYFDDHGAPHFHAHYAGSIAVVRIEPVGVITGNLPPRALSLVVEWATRYDAQLVDNWRRLRSGRPPLPIPPWSEMDLGPRVTDVQPLDPYRVRLTFSDGMTGIVDLAPVIVGRGGVFGPLNDPAGFSQVRLEPTFGTIEWPNGVDFCPDVLYSWLTRGAVGEELTL